MQRARRLWHGTPIRGVEIAKVHIQQIARRTQEASVLHLGGDLVVDYRLLVLADNINTELKVVRRLQLVRLRLAVLRR